MLDVYSTIQSFNAGRDPERLAMKYRKMRESDFVFLRGTCHLFYQRLPKADVLATAPLAWVCGDLHLENFGSYKGDNGLVYFDISDFDEAALAPLSWDLVRFLASVLVAARDMKASGAQARSLCKSFVDTYAAQLASGKALWVERDTADGLIKELLEKVRGRSPEGLLKDRTKRTRGRRRLHTDGEHALEVDGGDRERVERLIAKFARSREKRGFYKVLDVARRVAGTGSLGVERYVVLVEGDGSPNGNRLLDLKRALPSSLDARLKVRQPKWKADSERIVTLQQRSQAISMALLHPVEKRRASYVLRALLPSEDRVALDAKHSSLSRLKGVLREMGCIVASAHLRGCGRSGSANADALAAHGLQCKRWQKELMAVAQQCALQVRKDWQAFASAYDKDAAHA
jgi:uncharacterized protein (DUF2252 family)